MARMTPRRTMVTTVATTMKMMMTMTAVVQRRHVYLYGKLFNAATCICTR